MVVGLQHETNGNYNYDVNGSLIKLLRKEEKDGIEGRTKDVYKNIR